MTGPVIRPVTGQPVSLPGTGQHRVPVTGYRSPGTGQPVKQPAAGQAGPTGHSRSTGHTPNSRSTGSATGHTSSSRSTGQSTGHSSSAVPSRAETHRATERTFSLTLPTTTSSTTTPTTVPSTLPTTLQPPSSPGAFASDEAFRFTTLPSPSNTTEMLDEEDEEPFSVAPTDTVVQALQLISHLMADKLPTDHPSTSLPQGPSSLLTADLDESTTDPVLKTLPLSDALSTALAYILRVHPDSSAPRRSSFTRMPAYQPAATATSPSPMRLATWPRDEPGLVELAGKKIAMASILRSTQLSPSQVKDLWLASHARVAISSAQDWASAALHRAVTHVSAQLPSTPEGEHLRQQLDGVRHLTCYLGKTIEDGFKADATIAAQVTKSIRSTTLRVIPNLTTTQQTTLTEASLSGDSIFGGGLRSEELTASSERRRQENRMISALSRSRSSGRSYDSNFALPTGRPPRRGRPSTRGQSRPFYQANPTSSQSRQRNTSATSPSYPRRSRGRGGSSTSGKARPPKRV